MSVEPISSNPVKIDWEQGGTARLVSLENDWAVLLSDTAAPPGTPLRGRAEIGVPFEVKVRGCRRVVEAPAEFRIEGRLFNLSRREREVLRAALQNSDQGAGS